MQKHADMRLTKLMSSLALALTLVACDRTEPVTGPSAQTAEAARGEDTVAVASTLTVFDLSPDEKLALSQRALEGDAQASFRLAQFYSLGGGDGEPDTDQHDKTEQRRWLALATQQGHPIAKSNLAVSLTEDDCPRARSMMVEIRDQATDDETREHAQSWLADTRFACPE